jgi:beta-N-acetylhexosaminidase
MINYRMPAKSDSIPAIAGQLLIIGFDGVELSPALASLLKRVQPAGVILFARNIANAQQTHRLLRECQKPVREPLFTSVDLEGGRVDRFRNLTGPAPSAADVFGTGDRKLFRRHGELIGKICCTLGFNVDFAPVLDLAFEASKKVMSSRAFSTEPQEVILYAREFLAGLKAAKVIGAGKHFPGLGEGRLDSHEHLPVIEKSFNKLWAEDLVPYREMRRELAMVMVNHANYPAVTGDRMPASLSKKWISDILRRKIGYRGLIVSDDLEMGGIVEARPAGEAAVEFIRAGGDLGLVCHLQENVEHAYEAIVRESERSSSFRRRAAESAKRIAAFKRKSREIDSRAPLPSPEKISRLSTQLWEFSERVRLSALSAAAAAGGRQ